MSFLNFTTRSLVEYLQMRESATIPEIATHLQVPSPTVNGILTRLSKDGLVDRAALCPGKRGRPRVGYRLRLPGLVAAFQWEGTQLSGGLFDQDTRALGLRTVDSSGIATVQQAVGQVERLLAELLDQCGVRRNKLPGLALSVNAVKVGGQAVTSSVVPWADEHLGEALANAFNLPVRILLNPVILAEYRKFPEPAPHSMCLLRAGDGVSAHAIESGRRLLGRHSLAGELGHVTFQDQGFLCGCGRRGCLETICSGPAIRRRVLEDLSQGPISELKINEVAALSARATVHRIWRAWQNGDTFARAVMEPVFDALAWGLGLVANLFDPDVAIAGGYVLQDHPEWVTEIERRSPRWILHAAKRGSVLTPARAVLEDEMRVTALGFHPQVIADETVLPQAPRRRAGALKIRARGGVS